MEPSIKIHEEGKGKFWETTVSDQKSAQYNFFLQNIHIEEETMS